MTVDNLDDETMEAGADQNDFPGILLFGMFADGKMSTEEYLRQKQMDKELEG